MRNPNYIIRDVTCYVTPHGSKIHIIREGRWNGDRLELTPIGQENIQDKVQAYAPYCDLHFMLHRLGVGDKSVLCKSAPIYGDFSGMPDNPVDAINLINNARDRFDQLTKDTRQRYNNDYLKWLTEKLATSSPSNADKEVPVTHES